MRYRFALTTALLAAFLLTGIVVAGSGGAGVVRQASNAGTVKIFDGDKELPANDPKVCGAFTVQGLNFDANEQVEISIVGQGGPNVGGSGSYNATVTTNAQGAFATAPITLTPGMYKLDSEDGEGGGDKNKVFKVECQASVTTLPTGTTQPNLAPQQQLQPGAQLAPQAVSVQPRLTG